MTRIIGIDVYTSSYSAIQVSYAVCLVDSINRTYQLWENLPANDLISIFIQQNFDVLAVDHINELRLDPRLFEYLVDVPNLSIREISDYSSTHRTLTELTKLYGITLRTKPNPLKSAIICALLSDKTGRSVQLSRQNGKIMTVFQKIDHKDDNTTSIINQKIRYDPAESTHRHAYEELSNSTFISSMLNVIGYGKESIVYHVRDIQGRDAIAKTFRSYSPVARKILSQTYKAKSAHIPLIMARNEMRFLNLLYSSEFPVPKPYFRDDNTVIMEAICDDSGGIAQPLSQLDKSTVSQQLLEDLIYQGIDHLYYLFKELNLVHGDYSANNLLCKDDKLIIIDVSQAMRINTNTFTETPQRLRIDQGLETVFRDLDGFLRFFEKKFRVITDRSYIYDEFQNLIPDIFADKTEYITQKWETRFY